MIINYVSLYQSVQAMEMNSKRIINGWAFFDWANSAYALVIMVAIFPAYFLAVTSDQVPFGDTMVSNSVLYAYSISVAYLVIVFISPILSGIADYGNSKKQFLKVFTYFGSTCCLALFFFTGDENFWFGLITSVLAAIGFAGSLVFYNAYLPEIATEEHFDRVSAKGFAYGYFGSVLLLMINLVVIQFHDQLNIDQSLATRLSFLSVGLWWMGFSQISFRRLPKGEKLRINRNYLTKGYQELRKVWIFIKYKANIKRFLLSFFFYSMGVQTVLLLASSFAEKELQFETAELILLILILQLVAIAGAHIFAWVSKKTTNKFSIFTMLVIWVSICILAYFVHTSEQFYLLAVLVGMVMGGIQSISRSSYSKVIPEKTGDHASYFSFYEVLEKLGIVIGTASFGLIEQLSGGMRNSVLVLAAFFLIGMFFLRKVDIVDSNY